MSFDFVKVRMNFMILLLFLAGLGQSYSAQAQLSTLEFLCIRNDTLRWNPTLDPCGPFNRYLIYTSQDLAGPFTLLDSIADVNQLSYFHDGAGNNTRYYYLESDLDCPGLPAILSDTLDNRIPDPGPIRVVTVEGNTSVRVDWEPSPSPEVTGYIVSRQNMLGTTILDTVFTALTYTDFTANPADQSETYFVVALDPCGNVSLVPDPHQTILLEIAGVDSCNQEIMLNWSAYINWPNGVDRYEILASEINPANGQAGPYALAGAVEGAERQFVFPAPNGGRTYCFKVQAIEAVTDEVSFSNETCVEIGIIQAVRDLVITNLEVAPDQVAVQWILEPDVPLTSVALFRSEDQVNFSPLADINAADEMYMDPTNLANTQPLTYRIEAVDLCGNEVTSNAVSTIFLRGETSSGENKINWTPFFNEAARLKTYEVYRIIGSIEMFQAGYSQNELMHIDPIDISDPSMASACYYVVADTEIFLSNQTVNTRSVSNVVCLEQSAELFVPNAFVPDGVNRVFKPVLQFGGTQEYLMSIYDRYGGLIFESQDLATGWDGKKDGRPMPQGVYVYLIQMTQSGGQTIEKKGTVLLLR